MNSSACYVNISSLLHASVSHMSVLWIFSCCTLFLYFIQLFRGFLYAVFKIMSEMDLSIFILWYLMLPLSPSLGTSSSGGFRKTESLFFWSNWSAYKEYHPAIHYHYCPVSIYVLTWYLQNYPFAWLRARTCLFGIPNKFIVC